MQPQEKDHVFGTNIAHNDTLILARTGKPDEALERQAFNIDGKAGFSRWCL
jgi:hypothetical protein